MFVVFLTLIYFRFVGGIVTFVYVPILIQRKFPDKQDFYSIFNALVVLSCGSISSYAGGKLGEVAVREMGISGLAKLIAASSLLSLPPLIFAFVALKFWLAVSLLALVCESYFIYAAFIVFMPSLLYYYLYPYRLLI
jgi:hypothetical protein